MGDWRNPVVLGRTGLQVGRIGIGASYGVPQPAIESAFERGANLFYWGSLRREAMAGAIRSLAPRHRDRMVIAIQSFWRFGSLLNWSVARALRRLALDRVDILILGWHNRTPNDRLLDACRQLKADGRVRFLAVSGHNRPAFQSFIRDGVFDLLMMRYNAAHRGAESEIFPHLPAAGGPGVLAYTATRWGQLLDPRRIPPGEKVPRASDCYRFALSNPSVHVCLCGPKDAGQMDEALAALERGPLSAEEDAWLRRVGDAVHGKARPRVGAGG